MITFSIQNQEFGGQTLWTLLEADPSLLKVMIMAYKESTGAYEQNVYQYNEEENIKDISVSLNGNNIQINVNFNEEDFTLTEIDSASWYLTYVIIYSTETVFTGSYYKIEGDSITKTTDEKPVALLQKWANIDAVKVYNNLTDEHRYFYIGKDRKIYSELDDTKTDNVILTKDNDSEEITWKLPRTYDGVDLATKNISIYYVRPAQEDEAQPQGITETLETLVEDNYILATWIVTDLVTNVAGTLTYSIIAEGDGLKDEYFWQSKTSTFIIEKGIYGNLPTSEQSFKFIDRDSFRTDVYNTIEDLKAIHERGEIKWQSIASLLNPDLEV